MPEIVLSKNVPPLQRFWCRVEKTDDCWNWTGFLTKCGYGRFRGNDGRKILAHRFSWEFHRGPIPAGLLVLHQCDNRKCVNPDHLFIGDDAANCHDRNLKWRLAHKLTERQIHQIRFLSNFFNYSELSRMYCVHKDTVRLTAIGKIWKFVRDEAETFSTPSQIENP